MMKRILGLFYKLLIVLLVIAYFDKVFFDSSIGAFFDDMSDLLGFLWWFLYSPGMSLGYYFSLNNCFFMWAFSVGQLSAIGLMFYIYKLFFGKQQRVVGRMEEE